MNAENEKRSERKPSFIPCGDAFEKMDAGSWDSAEEREVFSDGDGKEE